MDDSAIVALYWQREESAITETAAKYGGLCHSIAMNILSSYEDAEECVSDTWARAWDSMPPQKPQSLRAYLGRITRNLSISRFRKNHAQKRGSGAEQLLSELEDCIPAPQRVEHIVEAGELAAVISRWLDTLPPGDRDLFVRRYWYGDSVAQLAQLWMRPAVHISQRLLRLRRKLKAALEKEGIVL